MRTLNDYFLCARIADISTGGQVYIPCPDGGQVVGLYAALNNAITSDDAVLTVKTANGTLGTLTVGYSGSAAGSVFSTEFSKSNEGVVPTGGYIEVETNGGSSTTCITEIVVVVRR